MPPLAFLTPQNPDRPVSLSLAVSKADEQVGSGTSVVQKHATTLPVEFHGLTNNSRTEAADLRVTSLDQDKEMIINGRVYDVSGFVKRHPGGSVIKFQLGSDASDAYNNFHLRSKKAGKMLASLPNRAVDEKEYAMDALSRDYELLRTQLEAEGYFKPNLRHAAYRIFEVVAMYAAGVYLIWNNYWWLGAFVAGIAQGRCGWLQHEAGHYSLTGNIKLDRHLQMMIYGVGCGMSGCYWRNQHNKHHATPQKLGADPDLFTLPLIAFHKIIGKKGNRLWMMMQAPLFFAGPICTMVAWGWQFVQHPHHSLRVKNFMELFWMGVRYALWYAAFVPQLGMWGAFALYTAYVTFGSTYIFTNFAVSHTHKDVIPKSKHISWSLYSANHTTNCSGLFNDKVGHSFVNWWMAYLNFQIEHHLFPSMPQYHHPQVSKRVRALFEKHGVEYDSRPYAQCMHDTFKNMWAVGHYDYHLDG